MATVRKTNKKATQQKISDKKIYGFGNNTIAQLGLDADKVFITYKPIELKEVIKKIVKVIVGSIHTFVIGEREVYSFGCNDEGALGRPADSDENKPTEVKIKMRKDEHIIDGAAAENATCLLSNLGNVYIAGSFRSMRKRLGSYSENQFEFSKVTGLKGIKKIAAGKNHFLFLSKTNDVFSMGNNEFNQLGVNKKLTENRRLKTFLVFKITNRKIRRDKVVDISTGLNCSFIKTENGIYVFGRNATNNLTAEHEQSIEAPMKIDESIYEKADKVVGGDGTLFVQKGKTVYGRGNNSVHQLNGTMDEKVVSAEKLHGNITDLTTYANFSLFLIDGHLYGSGSNTMGELGFDRDEMPYLKDIVKIPFDFTNGNVDRIVEFHAGNDFSLVVTEKNK